MADIVQDTASAQQETQLEQRVRELEEAVVAKEEAYKRALADLQNVRRQAQLDRSSWTQMACADLLTDILPTLDHLELALQHFSDPSLKMIVDELQRVLGQHGAERLKVVSKPFNPETMEAIDVVEGKKDLVVAEQQAGYRLNGRILRHAKVVVGGGDTPASEK